MTSPEIIIRADAATLNAEAARRWTEIAAAASAARGRFTVALSGGSTPRALYQLLATPEWRDRTPWPATHLFWGDERHVAPDHADSNYRMAREALIDHVALPPANIHRMKGEMADASLAATEYEEELRRVFQLSDGEPPRFDLILLGLGNDGHTASLFPGTEALAETKLLVAAQWVEKLATTRLTLTYPVINAAGVVMFLVSGAEKAETLREILEGDAPVTQYPAKGVQPAAGELLWLIDRGAGSHLKIRQDEQD
ncbi:MAG TPA: 6-phosphogluconolactonase [Pyrinomonadaceae bacterium]|nr:6-phosphogluconolactonase [Pyrinomonadaceae bacterium]